MIETVKKIMVSLSNSIGTIQHHYQEGNEGEAGKALKATVGNLDTVAKSVNDIDLVKGVDKKDRPEFFTKDDEFTDDGGIISLEDIPNKLLGDQIRPEVFNKIIEFSKEFTEILEDIDPSLLEDASSKKKTAHLGSGSRKSKPHPTNEQQSFFNENTHFDAASFFQMISNNGFVSGNAGGFSNFMKNPSVRNIHKQTKIRRKGISLPKLSTLVSARDYELVMSKHQLRQEAMEVCLPECEPSNTACNCRKLFECVKKMDEYDMAV